MTSIPSPQIAEVARARSQSDWTTVIGPNKGIFDWNLAELWSCRDLISLFVWRDFISLYKQTILGPAWNIVQPLLTTLIFTIIFGKFAELPTNNCPPFLFYLAGNVLWGFFANCLTRTANAFVANAGLMGKVYFHRMAIPISIVLSNLIAFAIQFFLFLGFWIFYILLGAHVEPSLWILALPLYVLMLAGYALGGGIIISALTTRYRDLAILVVFGTQLLMFLTPVIYPVSSVPKSYQWVVFLNPLSVIFEGFRAGFLGQGVVTVSQIAVSFVFMACTILVGLMLFTRVEKTFTDTI
jgi:lipopolysaccharide transport system permease protein